MTFVRYESLNETRKEVDLSQMGWVFFSGGVKFKEFRRINDPFMRDIVGFRRHCGGLLIIKRLSGTLFTELTLSDLKKDLEYRGVHSVEGYPELEIR